MNIIATLYCTLLQSTTYKSCSKCRIQQRGWYASCVSQNTSRLPSPNCAHGCQQSIVSRTRSNYQHSKPYSKPLQFSNQATSLKLYNCMNRLKRYEHERQINYINFTRLTLTEHSFSRAATTIWNSRPVAKVDKSATVNSFKPRLRTFFYRHAYLC